MTKDKTPTVYIQIEVPIDVHYAFKKAKKQSGDKRTLKDIYVEIITNQSKKIKS